MPSALSPEKVRDGIVRVWDDSAGTETAGLQPGRARLKACAIRLSPVDQDVNSGDMLFTKPIRSFPCG